MEEERRFQWDSERRDGCLRSLVRENEEFGGKRRGEPLEREEEAPEELKEEC